jgi:hypothetical protein
MLRKAQASFEYIMLVAIVLLFVVSGIGIIYQYSQRSNEEINVAAIDKIGQDIIDTAEKIYYVGGNSWQSIKFNVPSSVKGIYVINNNEVVVQYESYGGLSEAVFFSTVNITTPYYAGGSGNLSSYFHPGTTTLKFSSSGGNVIIQEIV